MIYIARLLYFKEMNNNNIPSNLAGNFSIPFNLLQYVFLLCALFILQFYIGAIIFFFNKHFSIRTFVKFQANCHADFIKF